MPSARKCIFCGKLFTGQETNFEHVIPQWLVDEADLQNRTAPVSMGSRSFDAPLKKIGSKVCKKCNDERSKLESMAKAVYVKIRDDVALTQQDGITLLDWLDKVRVGMWLWANGATPANRRLTPKFHINDRMAYADRIALIAKFPADKVGKGILFYGFDKSFMWGPSVMGMLTNNIAFFSLSSEFLLLRHLRNVTIKRTLLNNDHQQASLDLTTIPQEKLHLPGSSFAIGQCVMDQDLFDKMSVPLSTIGTKNRRGHSKVLRLNQSLAEIGDVLGIVPTTERNSHATLTLLELSAAKVSELLMRDYLKMDFSKVSDPRHRRSALGNAHAFHFSKTQEIRELTMKYQSLTGIRLLKQF